MLNLPWWRDLLRAKASGRVGPSLVNGATEKTTSWQWLIPIGIAIIQGLLGGDDEQQQRIDEQRIESAYLIISL